MSTYRLRNVVRICLLAVLLGGVFTIVYGQVWVVARNAIKVDAILSGEEVWIRRLWMSSLVPWRTNRGERPTQYTPRLVSSSPVLRFWIACVWTLLQDSRRSELIGTADHGPPPTRVSPPPTPPRYGPL